MSFAHWMSELQTQQHKGVQLGAESPASSWADTDSDSESDGEHGNFVFFKKSTCTFSNTRARKNMPQRTAPIMIPLVQSCVRPRSSLYEEEAAIACSHQSELRSFSHALHQYEPEYTERESEIDEDDPSLYGNLAYFRSQHGHKSALSFRGSSVSPRARQPDPSMYDEQIFDMEL